MQVDLLRHQEAFLRSLIEHPEIPFVFLIGGFGCLTGDALLSTPQGPVRLAQFEGGPVNTPLGPKICAQPTPVLSEIVEITGDDFQIRCNGGHLLKTGDGNWISASSLLAHSFAKAIYCNPLATSMGSDLLTQSVNVQRWIQTAADCLYGYLACFRFDDEQLLRLEEGDLDELPLLEYARNNNSLAFGDDEILQRCIRLGSLLLPLSKRRSRNPSDLLASVSVVLTSESYQRQREDFFLVLAQFLCSTTLEQSTPVTVGPISHSMPYIPPYISIVNEAAETSTVKTAQYKGIDTVYRLTVPDAECYYANGILHHNCGKSFSAVQLALYLYHAFHDSPEPLTFGILGVTIKLLKQTVLADLERAFDMGGISYRDNQQAGTLTTGNITYVYLPMQNPDDIYAFNFHGALCDEIDEVPAERVKAIVTAIQERCRKIIPPGHNFPSREPFIAFTTTAQGLGGTYQLINYFQQQNIPYIKVRGRTQDNTNLAPQQLKLLRSLYTPEEARAYLDGEFVNLAKGRVYAEFNQKKHIYMPFDVRDDDVIYVGQDFNYGHNAAAICIERAGIIYCVAEFAWHYVGEAPAQLRSLYPANHIILIPDASGKEIMQGFTEELEKYNIELFWNSVNPSVSERILGINRLLQWSQLYIFNGLNKLQMSLETRDFGDDGKPRKGKGPDAVDHIADALEYAVWRIIHSIKGYDKVLQAIAAVHHIKYTYDKEAA